MRRNLCALSLPPGCTGLFVEPFFASIIPRKWTSIAGSLKSGNRYQNRLKVSDITSANGARQTGPHSHQPSITTAQAPVSRRQLTSAIATVRSLTARVQASSANSGADVAEIRER